MPATPIPFGKYRLIRHIAFGSMSEVYLAEQSPGGEPIAIKRLMPHLSDDDAYRKMFLAEAQLASKLAHPNLLQVMDYGEVDGHFYQAMEYVQGQNVTAIFQHAQVAAGVPADLALSIVLAAAEGLHYAHQLTDKGRPMGIVHRDVSPQNILLTYDGRVKVLDFGVAHVAGRETNAASAGRLTGNAAYCSPEQLSGVGVDARADVFSLGVVLHELLTGHRLFHRESAAQTLLAVADGAIPRVSELHPNVSSELEQCVALALERDPQRRHQNAFAFACALKSLVSKCAEPLGAALHRLFPEKSALSR